MTHPERCQLFLIIPVHSDRRFAEKRGRVEAACQELGWNVMVPEYKLEETEFSIARMLELLGRAQLVLADLSLERPSCYFELGVVEASGTPVELIAETGTEVHQTSHRRAVRFYSGLDGFSQCVSSAILARSGSLLGP